MLNFREKGKQSPQSNMLFFGSTCGCLQHEGHRKYSPAQFRDYDWRVTSSDIRVTNSNPRVTSSN